MTLQHFSYTPTRLFRAIGRLLIFHLFDKEELTEFSKLENAFTSIKLVLAYMQIGFQCGIS